jgi:hypothetical protein
VFGSSSPQLSLLDALELTLLIARKDPRRHPRVAARWLQRYLEEDPAATIEEAGDPIPFADFACAGRCPQSEAGLGLRTPRRPLDAELGQA